jgi:hypothetical protein
VIEGSEVRDSIVGAGTQIRGCVLAESIIGDSVKVERLRGRTSLGDHSEVQVCG